MSADRPDPHRQPRQPDCAVITPIGPGHQQLAAEARDSVAAAFAEDPGIFANWQWIAIDDGEGRLGRSKARNQGVARAAASGVPWLFFLDADDLMDRHAFRNHARHADAVDGLWGMISAFSAATPEPELRPGQLGPTDDLLLIVLNDPFLTLQMGHFVRTSVALAHPFDERLDTGEDFDYYLRVWSDCRCRKIDHPLFHNRRGTHAGGPRSLGASRWRAAVREHLARASRRLEIVATVEHRGTRLVFHIDDPVANFQQELIRGRLPRSEELDRVLGLLPPRPRILLVGGCEVGPSAAFYAHFAHPEAQTWLLCPSDALGDALDPDAPPCPRRSVGGPRPGHLPSGERWDLVHLEHPGQSLDWLASLEAAVDEQSLIYLELAADELAPFRDLCKRGCWQPLEVMRDEKRQAVLVRRHPARDPIRDSAQADAVP